MNKVVIVVNFANSVTVGAYGVFGVVSDKPLSDCDGVKVYCSYPLDFAVDGLPTMGSRYVSLVLADSSMGAFQLMDLLSRYRAFSVSRISTTTQRVW